MDLRWLQINQATVSVDFKAQSLECFFFNSTFVLVIGGSRKANDTSVLLIDLVPEGLEVLEHDLVALVDYQHAIALLLNAANTMYVMKASLCVWLSLEQNFE